MDTKYHRQELGLVNDSQCRHYIYLCLLMVPWLTKSEMEFEMHDTRISKKVLKAPSIKIDKRLTMSPNLSYLVIG